MALDITLTAVNPVLSVFTLPFVIGLSIAHFLGDDATVGLQFSKVAQVFAIALVPVAVGTVVRGRFPDRARGTDKAVKIFSTVALALVIAAAVISQFAALREHTAQLGPATLLLSVLSLGVGYFVPRLFGVSRGDSTASAMEIGIHNATPAEAVFLAKLNGAENRVKRVWNVQWKRECWWWNFSSCWKAIPDCRSASTNSRKRKPWAKSRN